MSRSHKVENPILPGMKVLEDLPISQMDGVVFQDYKKGCYVVFGPNQLLATINKYEGVRETYQEKLSQLPENFLRDIPNRRILDGAWYGLPEGTRVALVPMQYLPKEFPNR